MQKNVSIVLPVINETASLEETVRVLVAENRAALREILIMVAPRTTPESRVVIERLRKTHPSLIVARTQELPFLGGAMRDAFRLAAGEWVVMMASDLETDPHAVKRLVGEAATGAWDIVTVSRWGAAGGFKAYNPLKLVLNFIFQKCFQLLYRTRLTDLTYGFRIFRAELLRRIRWEEFKHPFLFETLIKPLKLGYKVKEIPARWEARKEGTSQNTFLQTFAYWKIGMKTLFMSKRRILVP